MLSLKAQALCKTYGQGATAVEALKATDLVVERASAWPSSVPEENIVLPLLLAGRAADAQASDEIVDLLGLGDRRHHLPDALSGGEQQRVAIGRALVTRPAVILADEPTGNLDTGTAGQVLDLLISSARRSRCWVERRPA